MHVGTPTSRIFHEYSYVMWAPYAVCRTVYRHTQVSKVSAWRRERFCSAEVTSSWRVIHPVEADVVGVSLLPTFLYGFRLGVFDFPLPFVADPSPKDAGSWLWQETCKTSRCRCGVIRSRFHRKKRPWLQRRRRCRRR